MNLADLSDTYSDTLQYVQPNLFRNYGGKSKFGGMISTVKCHEDNLLVKQTLNEPGNKRVRQRVLNEKKKNIRVNILESHADPTSSRLCIFCCAKIFLRT